MTRQLVYVAFDGIFQQGLDDLLNGTDAEMTGARDLLDEVFAAL